MRERNSSRVFGSVRKTPSIAEVTVVEDDFWTPLISMHICLVDMVSRQVPPSRPLPRFKHDGNAKRLENLHDCQGDLLCQPLLYL